MRRMGYMKKNNKNVSLIKFIIILFVGLWLYNEITSFLGIGIYENEHEYNDKSFYVIASNDNKILDESLKKYANKKGYDIVIEYDDTLEIVDRLNSGEKFDAVFASNSIWLSMLDSSVVKTSSLRSTSISPIIFGIKDSKAEELGFKNKKVYTSDILKEIYRPIQQKTKGNLPAPLFFYFPLTASWTAL